MPRMSTDKSEEAVAGFMYLTNGNWDLIRAALSDSPRFETAIHRMVSFRVANEKLYNGKASTSVLYDDASAASFFNAAAADSRSTEKMKEFFLQAADTYPCKDQPPRFKEKVSSVIGQIKISLGL